MTKAEQRKQRRLERVLLLGDDAKGFLAIENTLLEKLNQLSPRPTLREAEERFAEPEIRRETVAAALKARELGSRLQAAKLDKVHYDKFFVGGVGIGLTLAGRDTYAWFVHADRNSKESQSAKKYCAEMRIMRVARECHCAYMIGMAVVGKPRLEDTTKTLHPCEACRALMRDRFRSLFRATTPIIMLNPETGADEVKSVGALMRYHHERWEIQS